MTSVAAAAISAERTPQGRVCEKQRARRAGPTDAGVGVAQAGISSFLEAGRAAASSRREVMPSF